MTAHEPLARLNRLCRAFLVTSGALLTLTAVGKVIALLGDAKILNQPNPLFSWLSNREMLFAAALLELVVAWWVFRRKSDMINKLLLVAWLGGLFLSYRAVLWWTGYGGSCSCLGHLSDALHISSEKAEWIAKLVLAYLLIGSITLACMCRRRLTDNAPAKAILQPGSPGVPNV